MNNVTSNEIGTGMVTDELADDELDQVSGGYELKNVSVNNYQNGPEQFMPGTGADRMELSAFMCGKWHQ